MVKKPKTPPPPPDTPRSLIFRDLMRGQIVVIPQPAEPAGDPSVERGGGNGR